MRGFYPPRLLEVSVRSWDSFFEEHLLGDG